MDLEAVQDAIGSLPQMQGEAVRMTWGIFPGAFPANLSYDEQESYQARYSGNLETDEIASILGVDGHELAHLLADARERLAQDPRMQALRAVLMPNAD